MGSGSAKKLIRHKSLMHEIDRQKCLQCGYTAKTKITLKLHIMKVHNNYSKQFQTKTQGARWTKHWMDKLAKNVAESCSPFDGGKIEGNNGLNANEENKIDTLASEKNTAEEYEMEGRIESSKDEKEITTPDAQMAIKDSVTIYDTKEENTFN